MADYLEVKEAAERLKVGRQRIYELIRDGHLAAVKDDRRMWMVRAEDVRTLKLPPMGRPRKSLTQ